MLNYNVVEYVYCNKDITTSIRETFSKLEEAKDYIASQLALWDEEQNDNPQPEYESGSYEDDRIIYQQLYSENNGEYMEKWKIENKEAQDAK